MAEVVRLAQAGLIVASSDEEAMADAILRMATEEGARQVFTQNATAAFQAHFTLPVMVNEYMRLYRNTPRMRRRNA
jgi:glycosyltransferase involved in cell wall biosynthesis